MKKTQKKLGNKGFSLVELIVVIAIMAVLVGVLAPTLIKNIEKSRESKDAQNIEQIKSAVEVALQNETAYADEVPTVASGSPSGSTSKVLVTLNKDSGTISASTAFSSELSGTMDVTKAKLTSKKYKSATVTFYVNDLGQVNVSESGVK